MKINFFVIPLIVLATALIGGRLTAGGVRTWYRTIKLPSWTPGGRVIGTVWSVLFILSAISALIVWNSGPRTGRFWAAIAVLLLNAVLNVGWSLLFFRLHLIGAAAIEAAALGLSVIVIMALVWPFSAAAALLLAPYAAWSGFAAYLTYSVWKLNRPAGRRP